MININITIAGASVFYDNLIKDLPILKLKNKDLNFSVYDGPNLCKWNGGRINRDIILSKDMINRYNSFNIPIELTFTNPIIDLNDKIGNELLRELENSGKKYNIKNKIILINEDFRKYLYDNFSFELIYSITGTGSLNVPMEIEDYNFYRDLEDKYDLIVPRMEHIFDPLFLKLDQKKYKVMVNDTCSWNCPYYSEHFNMIALQNTLFNNPIKDLPELSFKKIEECWLPKFDPDIISSYNEMDINRENILILLNQGIINFKISGRENNYNVLLQELKKYIGILNERKI